MKRSNFKSLKLKQIVAAIERKTLIPVEKIGQRLRDVREVLGMTQKQMARKLKVSQSAISQIEENIESSKLKTILKLARALECEFMGAIVSRVSLEKIIKKHAEKAAKRLLNRIFASMALEKQAPSERSYRYQLKRLTQELAADPGPELWEE